MQSKITVRDVIKRAIQILYISKLTGNKDRASLARETIRHYWPLRNTGAAVIQL